MGNPTKRWPDMSDGGRGLHKALVQQIYYLRFCDGFGEMSSPFFVMHVDICVPFGTRVGNSSRRHLQSPAPLGCPLFKTVL